MTVQEQARAYVNKIATLNHRVETGDFSYEQVRLLTVNTGGWRWMFIFTASDTKTDTFRRKPEDCCSRTDATVPNHRYSLLPREAP